MPYRSLKPSDLFNCKKCGDCCRGYGGTYVSPEDIRAISAFLEVGEKTFEDRYCAPSGNRLLIRQGKDGYCAFFKNDLCTIHPVKPKMCRAWPFIDAVLRDPANWQIMAGFCPGMRTDIPDAVLRKLVQKVISDG